MHAKPSDACHPTLLLLLLLLLHYFCMDPVELAPTLRPLLENGEKIVSIQNKVGLYKGAERDEEHDSGTVYLTTHRIVYVDQLLPRHRSLALDISRIQRCSAHSGFLYSSAKIHIYLNPATGGSGSQTSAPAAEPSRNGRVQYMNGAPGMAPNPPGVAHSKSVPDISQLQWKCTICDHVNRGVSKCGLCGVPAQEPMARANGMRSGPYASGSRGSLIDDSEQSIACPVCTFDNHASMARCEMCDNVLLPPDSGQQGEFGVRDVIPRRMSSTGQESADSDGDAANEPIKLSFRAGGSSSFYSALKEAISDKAWTAASAGVSLESPTAQSSMTAGAPFAGERRPTIGGISTIVSAAHESERARDAALNTAFSDLDALVAKANEIVGLAEHIATQLNSPAASKLRSKGKGDGDEDNAERADAFKQYLLDLGIDSPVTKDTAGAVFHEELARELCEYLENYVSQSGGTVALVDAYCLYNRAREFSLVYPADFVQACRKFEQLNLLLRLRQYPSGLLVLEDASSASDASIISRIDSYVSSFGPITANDLATIEECPLTLAEEHLWLCERAGRVCRDESVEGIRFYPNVFLGHAAH
ncbi:Vps36-domain-containing protein [Martensiomyces pterosporus]|nr:Vps36-domain-containing protein [Martensiomyces pterosporus]